MANYYDSSQKYNTQSAVFRAAGAKFIEYQEISTHGAHDMTSFEYKGHTHFLFLTALEVSSVTQLFRLRKVRKKAKSRVRNEGVLGNFSKQFTFSKADIKKGNKIKTRVFACFWSYVSLQNGGFI